MFLLLVQKIKCSQIIEIWSFWKMIGIFDILAYKMYKIHQPSPDIYHKHQYLSINQLKMACPFMKVFLHHKIHPYFPVKLFSHHWLWSICRCKHIYLPSVSSLTDYQYIIGMQCSGNRLSHIFLAQFIFHNSHILGKFKIMSKPTKVDIGCFLEWVQYFCVFLVGQVS